MISTRLTKLLGIKYPIIQGAMAWISNAEFAAAVSNAGALGVITPLTKRGARKELELIRDLTSNPFGLNIPLAGPSETLVDLAIKYDVEIVTCSGGDPARIADKLNQHGIKFLALVGEVRHALRSQQLGACAVIASGYESGGHISRSGISTLVLVPQIVDAVRIPVVAAGGIADGRGLAAALVLGADGVQMGTRFLSTQECPAHPKYKQAILNAKDTDTMVIGFKTVLARVLRNRFAQEFLELEQRQDKSFAQRALLEVDRARMGLLNGDLDGGILWCGQVAGMIKDLPRVDQLIQSIMEQAHQILSNPDRWGSSSSSA